MNCPRCGKAISEHDAGRETDACVAEVVMGFKRMAYRTRPTYYWLDDPQNPHHMSIEVDGDVEANSNAFPYKDGLRFVPMFSTSWDAMEDVIAHLNSMKLYVIILHYPEYVDCAIGNEDKNTKLVIANGTAPLAVCRAALSAMAGGGGRD